MSTVDPSSCPLEPPSQLVALLACHNRRELTLQALRALGGSRALQGIRLKAVLVDDGSSDGTADAVRSAFPWVTVLQADGTLYWCRAMHRAFEHAWRDRPDFVLWLNDDTVLLPDGLAAMLQTFRQLRMRSASPLIVAGATVDPDSGVPTYGGRVRVSRWRPTAWRLQPPARTPMPLDTMDGNLVLLHREVVEVVGLLDPAFEHAMGDYDYALRAARLGVELWQAPGVAGHCRANDPDPSVNGPPASRLGRIRQLWEPKRLPPRSWWRFTRRHAGWLWPLVFTWPYLRAALARPSKPATRLDGA